MARRSRCAVARTDRASNANCTASGAGGGARRARLDDAAVLDEA